MSKEILPHVDHPNASELLGSKSTQLFVNQVLIALLLKHAKDGKYEISVADIDATSGHTVEMGVDPSQKNFTFEVRKKQ